MANGDIVYVRFPITLDSNGAIDTGTTTQTAQLFLTNDFDIIDTVIVPISGGSGISNAVMVVVARRQQ